MKKIIMIMVLGTLMAYLVPAQAQTFQNPNAQQNQNQQMVQTGARYTGTVYEPFTESVPSEQSAVGASYAPSRPGQPKTDLGHGTDGGNQSTEYPIGDAVLPLLLMAMVYGVWCMVNRRKRRV